MGTTPIRSAWRRVATVLPRAPCVRNPQVDRQLKITLILDPMHVLERLWKAAHVFHAEGCLEADPGVMDRTLRILSGDLDVSGS